MEKEFAPYELAVKLKELGFDEPCIYYFNKSEHNQLWQDTGSGYYRNSVVSKGNLLWGETYDNGNVSAPLWQQAFSFILSKIDVEIDSHNHYVVGFDGQFYLNKLTWIDYEGYHLETISQGNTETLEELIELLENETIQN